MTLNNLSSWLNGLVTHQPRRNLVFNSSCDLLFSPVFFFFFNVIFSFKECKVRNRGREKSRMRERIDEERGRMNG